MSQTPRAAFALLALSVALGAACSSGSTTGDASGGDHAGDGGARGETGTATTSEGGSTAAVDAGASCNTLTQLSSGVAAEGAGGPLFTRPTGGPIPDGLYVLTGFKVYAQSIPAGPIAGDKTGGITLDVRGSTVQFLIDVNGGQERATATMALTSNSIHFSYSCNLLAAGGGQSAPSNRDYTATAAGLVLVETNSGVSNEWTFSKR